MHFTPETRNQLAWPKPIQVERRVTAIGAIGTPRHHLSSGGFELMCHKHIQFKLVYALVRVGRMQCVR